MVTFLYYCSHNQNIISNNNIITGYFAKATVFFINNEGLGYLLLLFYQHLQVASKQKIGYAASNSTIHNLLKRYDSYTDLRIITKLNMYATNRCRDRHSRSGRKFT